jgi:hypothetical protein
MLRLQTRELPAAGTATNRPRASERNAGGKDLDRALQSASNVISVLDYIAFRPRGMAID